MFDSKMEVGYAKALLPHEKLEIGVSITSDLPIATYKYCKEQEDGKELL